MAKWIDQCGYVSEDYDRIYFTGEGALRYIQDIRGSFLQMKKNAPSAKEPYSFVPVVPDFL